MYQCIISSPQIDVIRKLSTIKGPKGITSLLFLIPQDNKTIDATAPNKKERKMLKNILGIPNIKPKTPISLISPPPIPPFDTINIIVKSNPLRIKAIILFSKLIRWLFVISYIIAIKNINITRLSDMI